MNCVNGKTRNECFKTTSYSPTPAFGFSRIFHAILPIRYKIETSTQGGPVAQRLEQRTHNPLVPGSNPGGPTSSLLKLLSQAGFGQRQFADALPGSGKNRVADCRRNRRKPRFANTARRRVVFHDVHVNLARSSIHSRYGVRVKVGLVDSAVRRGDLAVERDARSHDRRA